MTVPTDLVFLHGKAAAGKLTTARELGRRLNYPVFHNHLVVNLLVEVFPFGSPEFVALRERMWLDVFAEAARIGRPLIFTFAPEATVPDGFPARTVEVVTSAGGRVRFVRLDVSDVEQERRLPAASRHEVGKLTDVELLRRGRFDHGLTGPRVEQPPAELVVDTERHPPEESAELIIAVLGLAPIEPVPRFPD